MINKFTLSRVQEIRFVKEHLDEFIANNISLSRYEDDDPLKDIAERNFYATYDYILSHPEVENDYKCLLDLHTAMAFSNKIMVDNGCGFLTVPVIHKKVFREKLQEYKDRNDFGLKDWVYMYCVKGPKLDY